MKKTIVVGTTVWRNITGNAILEVTDFSSSELANLKNSTSQQAGLSAFLKHPTTIAHWKQRFGGMQAHLTHPASKKQFLFDLRPWSHLPDTTYLWLHWKFVPQQPLFHTQP
jgi:hypothetical protein